ncbi:MAG: hypothetical protein MK008_08720 [Bdellovibrionales bacterium]|nr:hypothetical protein [Bdellovibrionales bacterium]
MLKSFVFIIVLFPLISMSSQDTEVFKGIDTKTGKDCSLTYNQGEYTFAYTSYTKNSEFVITEAFGGARRGRNIICDSKYSFCFFGNAVNPSTGEFDDKAKYTLEGAFSKNGSPVYFKLVSTSFNSNLNKECVFN